MKAVLISTYEMGRQPFGLASPAAWLRARGWDVACVDASRDKLNDDRLRDADLIGFHLPMHTATRLAAPLIRRARTSAASARICAYGVYAPLNAEWLKSIGVDAVFGGEFEEDLITWAGGAGRAAGSDRAGASGAVPRIHFLVPDRTGLPPLSRYATLQLPDGSRRTVGYTEASRGCKHLCRHCPIVPIYNGQFRIVPVDVVLADVDAQVRAGAQHVTFGDPDFFNGPAHAAKIVDVLRVAHPGLSYDVTIKIEHLLRHRDLLPRLAASGCAFVTSAVESVDDAVLARLEKGHTRADFVEAVAACRAAGVTLVPTFVAFHPWLSLPGYCDLLDTIESLALVDHVAPIQLAIRLLVPDGSRLLALDDVRARVRGFDPDTLTHRWSHEDPRVDALHQEVSTLVGMSLSTNRSDAFDAISDLAHARAGVARPATRPKRDRSTVPYLNEPWYC